MHFFNSPFKKRGMTLLEIVVSTFIINVVIISISLSIAMMLRAGQHLTDTSEGYIVASSILNQYMTDLKLNRSSSLKVNSGYQQIYFGKRDFLCKIEAKPVGNSLQELTVSVKWGMDLDHSNNPTFKPNSMYKLEATVSTILHVDSSGQYNRE